VNNDVTVRWLTQAYFLRNALSQAMAREKIFKVT